LFNTYVRACKSDAETIEFIFLNLINRTYFNKKIFVAQQDITALIMTSKIGVKLYST